MTGKTAHHSKLKSRKLVRLEINKNIPANCAGTYFVKVFQADCSIIFFISLVSVKGKQKKMFFEEVEFYSYFERLGK